jgi:hypothetical protein
MKSYKIVRFHFMGENEVIKTGQTLEQAQEWCRRDNTRGDGWFDGYDEEVRSKAERAILNDIERVGK